MCTSEGIVGCREHLVSISALPTTVCGRGLLLTPVSGLTLLCSVLFILSIPTLADAHVGFPVDAASDLADCLRPPIVVRKKSQTGGRPYFAFRREKLVNLLAERTATGCNVPLIPGIDAKLGCSLRILLQGREEVSAEVLGVDEQAKVEFY